MKRTALELLAVSLIALLQELALIRWFPGQVRVLAYFPNLILISAFLGLGLGCLRAGRRSLLWAWPLSLLALTLAAFAMSRIAFTQESESEHLWLLYYNLPANHWVVHDVRLPIVLAFVLSAASFLPLGQVLAERLARFKANSDSLRGYGLDLLGSLAGVALFAVIALLQTFPVVWFATFLTIGMLFFAGSRRHALAYAALAAAIVAAVGAAERADRYSPYYALSTGSRDVGETDVLTNGSLHQTARPVARADPIPGEVDYSPRIGYHLPFRVMNHLPRRALVLGAGTGNDVATLLDEGVEQVDAVEIDPAIVQIGRERHPDHPYDSPRVRVFVTDARSFLNNSRDRYDLIVFGTLDSMTRLSALSNVRLDNFVYTENCLLAAREHLADGGGVAMFFMVGADYIDQRLGAMLTRVFGQVPAIFGKHYITFNRILMAGPLFDAANGAGRTAAARDYLKSLGPQTIPTDDWPFLYLRGRALTPFYLTLMALFALLAIGGVVAASGEMRASVLAGRADWPMFLFGLAFLLLESRSVTVMNLVWGATWLTSAVVFGAILFVILLATLGVRAGRLPALAGSAGLAVTLVAEYFLPMDLLLTLDVVTRLALSVLFVGAPIFFAGVCFAALFRDREESAAAIGWNLLGAVTGGLLEFLSMVMGLKALLLLALAAYLLAFLLLRRAPRATPVPVATG